MGTVGTHQKCFDFKHNRHYQHTWTAWVHAHFADEAAIRAAWKDYPMTLNDTWAQPEVPAVSTSNFHHSLISRAVSDRLLSFPAPQDGAEAGAQGCGQAGELRECIVVHSSA
jgi:hypothetical protein